MAMLTPLRHFIGLPAPARRLLAEAIVVLMFFALLLKRGDLHRAVSWGSRLPRRRRGHAITARQLAEAVVRVSRHVPGQPTCLARALAVQALLRRYRHAGQLRFGARRNLDGVFDAHAWVEHEGQVLIGHAPAHYRPLL